MMTTDHLSSEIRRRWWLRSCINAIHLGRLDQLETLPGFSGIHGTGTWVGGTNASNINDLSLGRYAENPGAVEILVDKVGGIMIQDEEDKTYVETMDAITTFVSDLD
jgi:hypothetical protein